MEIDLGGLDDFPISQNIWYNALYNANAGELQNSRSELITKKNLPYTMWTEPLKYCASFFVLSKQGRDFRVLSIVLYPVRNLRDLRAPPPLPPDLPTFWLFNAMCCLSMFPQIV